MNASQKGLDVSIMGREYRVACPPDQEPSLLEAVAYLDHKMREIRDQGKVVGLERIAVMAAARTSARLSGAGCPQVSTSERSTEVTEKPECRRLSPSIPAER